MAGLRKLVLDDEDPSLGRVRVLRLTRRIALLAAVGVFVASALPAAADHKKQSGQEAGEQRRSTTDQLIDTPMEVDVAKDDQHGGEGGHLPGSRDDVKLLGRADIEGAAPGRVADVAAFGNFAYLTVRDPQGCSDAGVAIMDISKPRKPAQVGFIESTEGSFPGEGAQVVDLDTESFTGQVLVFNNEICALGGEGGFSLWDVTDPANPVVLTAHGGDNDPGGFVSEFNQIHSAFAWQAGDQAYVVIVDNEEFTDVDIFEITDPTNAVFISELDLNDFDVDQPELGLTDSFLHDMVVKEIDGRFIMLLSYWDGGYVMLDVTDPANAEFLRDTEFAAIDPELLESLGVALTPEGNAHQAEFTIDNRFFIGTDEDFAPYRTDELRIASGAHQGEYPSVIVPGAAAPAILPDLTLNGPVVYGGYGCPDSDPIPTPESIPGYLDSLEAGEEKIIVLQRGPVGDPSATEEACFPGEKAHAAAEAGWDAVLFVNHHSGDAAGGAPFCGSGAFVDEIVGVCTTHAAFHRLFDLPPLDAPWTYPEDLALGAIGADIEVGSIFDGWGYVHLFDAETMEELDTFAIDEAHDPEFAFGFGDLSVHEVAVDPVEQGLAYLSYYSGGLRVIRYGDRGIKEVGHYIDKKGNDFWGVEVHFLPKTHQKLILASDRDSGLWIFKFTGRTDKRFERFVGRNARLSGAKEVPGPGDPDGRGTARIRLHANAGEVCYRVDWKRIGSPTAAHIHEGTKDVAGPVVVTLFQGGQSGKRPLARGCIDEVDRALVADIVKRPRHYYVNVHNAEFPGGAIRGQLFNP